jgi:hypothetical protein
MSVQKRLVTEPLLTVIIEEEEFLFMEDTGAMVSLNKSA